MYLLLKLVFLLALAYTLLNLYLFYKRSKYRHIPSPPIPLSWIWFMGHLPDLNARKSRSPNINLIQLTSEYHKEYRWDMFRLSFFHVNIVFCANLSVVQKIMTDAINFPKDRKFLDAFDVINKACGEKLSGRYGILALEGGEIWRVKRRIIDPAFKKSFLRNIMVGMNEVALDLVKGLENKKGGTVFDITSDLGRSAMMAVSICGFDWNQKLVEEQGQNAQDLANLMVEVIAIAIKQPFEFSLPWNDKALKLRYKNLALTVKKAMTTHLEMRMKNDNSGDILSHIIRANECSDQLGIDDLVDDYSIFLVAGMETTAITMATVVQFLSNHPEECRKVQEEVDEVFEGKECLEYEDIVKFEYLENVIKESLRMRGPVMGTWRVCKNDDITIEGVHFPKETKLVIPIDVIHHDGRYWENPSVFTPDRFSGESGKNIRPFTYMPFSAGLRNCIGKNFAMLEMKILLSNIFRRFEFVNPHPEIKDPPRMGNITVRPLNGVPIKLYHR
ncbi:cholesterol 24-hydroxylase-like [Bolinopsis microptera]|uniref:cholesterol 24-hydroxylase-like n=1 Tax=Bolinopsis microptera TaxID=2820187 RepID=UPI00307A2D88